jgi:hypothetical protein
MKQINMLLLGIITLVMTIPLASLYLSTILIHRFADHVLLDSCIILGSAIYGWLFQITTLSQSLEIFLLILSRIILFLVPEEEKINNYIILKGYLLIILFITLDGFSLEESNILLTCFVPMMIYSNTETDRSKILSDNKGRAAIYM